MTDIDRLIDNDHELYRKIKDLMNDEVSEVPEEVKLELSKYIRETIKPKIDEVECTQFSFMFATKFQHDTESAKHALADWFYNFSFYHLGKSPLAWYAYYCIASHIIDRANEFETSY